MEPRPALVGRLARRSAGGARLTEYLWAVAIVVASTSVCLATRQFFQTVDQAMIFLLGIVLCARCLDLGPSILAVAASVAAFDFFFVPPYHTLSVLDARYLVTFAVMLVVGLIVSRLTVQVRGAEAARITAETERTRNTLLSAVSHDLRSPLATVSGAAEALLETPNQLDAGARRELLETIREEAGRLTRVINGILDLTRLTSGAFTVQKEWHPLEEIVGSALARADVSLRDHPVNVDLPKTMLLVPVDATLLEQVIINLLENAAKYSPDHAPIDVRGRLEGGEVVGEVLDRGPGIAQGEEEAVFERFYRSPDARRAAGTGLGLAICKAIVRAHGGSISATARDGGGSVFRFTLPREADPPAIEDSLASSGGSARS